MTFNYSALSYAEKRDYIIQLLTSFKDRGASFSEIAARINEDAAYPEAKMDFIEERFAHYLDKTKADKTQAYADSVHKHPVEEATSDAELEQILSRL